jgi:predicted CopG family antitoxin
VVLVVKMPVSIKISEENYKKLSSLSGKLRERYQKPVSINDAIHFLYSKGKISDLAGSWSMSDKEAEDLAKNLRKGWSRWKTKSA